VYLLIEPVCYLGPSTSGEVAVLDLIGIEMPWWPLYNFSRFFFLKIHRQTLAVVAVMKVDEVFVAVDALMGVGVLLPVPDKVGTAKRLGQGQCTKAWSVKSCRERDQARLATITGPCCSLLHCCSDE
jgi:hypothetical protein